MPVDGRHRGAMGSICSTIFLKLKGSPPDPNDSKPDVPPRRSDRYECTDTTEGEGRDNDAMQRDDEAPVTKKQEETRMDAKTIDWRYARDPTLKHRTVLSPHDIEGFIKEGIIARNLKDNSRVAWSLIGGFVAFCPKSLGFESRCIRGVRTLGKSFTHSCLWRIGVKLRHSTALCRERL